MFNDATRPHAGRLVDHNPFAGLGLQQSRGPQGLQPPAPGEVARLIALADELTPPCFAAYLFTRATRAMRPGELDALRLDDLDFTPGAETIRIERQWNAKTRKITPPKHGSVRTIAMTSTRCASGCSTLPRESEWVFTTLRGTHYTPCSRSHHWNRVRCAAGLGQTDLYTRPATTSRGTRSTCSSSPEHVDRAQLGHRDGGELVRELYGHPDAAIAREKIRAAFATAPAVPVSLDSRRTGT